MAPYKYRQGRSPLSPRRVIDDHIARGRRQGNGGARRGEALRRRSAALQNALHLVGLILGERRLEDRAAVASELLSHIGGVGRAQQRKNRRVARLNHVSDAFYKVVRNAELVLPPVGVD